MKTIYLYTQPAQGWGPGDVVGYALCEDGACIASHLSSSEDYARHDLGLTSKVKHDLYAAHCPEGYALEWVDDPDTHAEFEAAFQLNRKQAADAEGGAP